MDLERWQRRSAPHSPQLQHYWKLTIKLFSVVSGTHVGRVLPLCRKAVGVFNSPNRLGKHDRYFRMVEAEVSTQNEKPKIWEKTVLRITEKPPRGVHCPFLFVSIASTTDGERMKQRRVLLFVCCLGFVAYNSL